MRWLTYVRCCCCAMVWSGSALGWQMPRVQRVEPPDWVAADKDTKVRIAVSGSGFEGARISSGGSSAQVRLTQSSPATVSRNGHYVFFDLLVPAGMKPGPLPLRLTTNGGSAEIPFRLTAALPAATNFRGFTPEDVIYLVMPDRFANGDVHNDDPAVSRGLYNRRNPRFYHGGDFAGIREHLPYLKSLGVTALWLTPIYENANRIGPADQYKGESLSSYHGYGATDFYGVEEHFGTLDDYVSLVAEAHRLGMKVIQDQVANHTGTLHPWVEDPPFDDWFHGSASHHTNESWQLPSLLDPHAGAALRASVLDGWFGDTLPDLNQDNAEVRRYLIQNTLWWIGRTGVDAIREDTVPYAPRTFWRDWTGAIHQAYPHVNVVGEVWDEDIQFTSAFQGGHTGRDGVDTGIDAVFDFPLYFAIRKTFAAHGSPEQLLRVLARDTDYVDASKLVTFVGLHDTARFISEAKDGAADLQRALTFLFTVRGTPMIYYGDEIGMAGRDDPDNRRDYPGGWPGDPQTAFDAAQRLPEQRRIFDLVAKLTRLRASSPALQNGGLRSLYGSSSAFAFLRTCDAERVLVVVHNRTGSESIHFDADDVGAEDGSSWENALTGGESLQVNHGKLTVDCRGFEVLVYRKLPRQAAVKDIDNGLRREAITERIAGLRHAGERIAVGQ